MKKTILAAAALSTILVLALGAGVATAKPSHAGQPAEASDSSVVHVTEGESIQEAIDDARDGATIFVHEGTYEELLTIDGKDIKLVAVGDVVIKNPSPDQTILNRRDTVMVSNSECTIKGFTIDVNNGFGGIYAFGGPSYGTGEVELTVRDCKVMNYDRNGITANGELATGHFLNNNMFIGEMDSNWANNGIQIGWGATGIIKGNTIKTNYWIGEEWTATGILIFDAKNVKVIGNTVKDCETGIGVLGVNNKVVNNELISELEKETSGIVVWDTEPYLDWGLTYKECKNNKVIHNTFDGYDTKIVDLGEDSKVHANVLK
ncbi:MAG: Lipoprotein NosD family containing CASH domain [Candidatus Methanohalarchaeum thermophilum]|uniref:Lipoprotein NosD family containing CASH domain n=1 Tax=Methanohalarchaeum thermophilum TaxID=1903181 RepID=A0A1Q6DWD1_METT1|nr:MAG: Lipoprotein NosD family containing CASH domain [Candidatus Methanohalarchaeum thermophilum]